MPLAWANCRLQVRDMIRLVKPDTVMVELCAGRAARLRAGEPASEMGFFKVPPPPRLLSATLPVQQPGAPELPSLVLSCAL